ncbi:hypothetical protein MesoLjLc_09130 [Mesorhizobium sp. L-8-10]|uniref:hypothetical protein n=1 Tax=unclassified Mesorhizobium TaxID=325217 RepID=UPI0019281F8B|nr:MULTISPECIES: hypothetical protein [unclassified Mesorhizobium]BCH21142.1 hypothetical protein MesoLjLb_09270 [Mesorhizobium sp. L-8-3]BCH28983.1 hypothetical protein MesoLjLc_09130 [Mesorhizobium sp. L-8-10]
MSGPINILRKHIHPRAEWSAWEPRKPVRASDVIVGLMLVMACVVLVASALTRLFAAV